MLAVYVNRSKFFSPRCSIYLPFSVPRAHSAMHSKPKQEKETNSNREVEYSSRVVSHRVPDYISVEGFGIKRKRACIIPAMSRAKDIVTRNIT